MSEAITIAEAARLRGVSTVQVRRWIREGGITVTNPGWGMTILASDLINYQRRPRGNPKRIGPKPSTYKYFATWRARHRAQYQALDSEYKSMKRNKVYQELWPIILDHYRHRCLACRMPGKLCTDHVQPLTLGGRNHLDNLQPLCRRCNGLKVGTGTDYRPDGGAWIRKWLEDNGKSGDCGMGSTRRKYIRRNQCGPNAHTLTA